MKFSCAVLFSAVCPANAVFKVTRSTFFEQTGAKQIPSEQPWLLYGGMTFAGAGLVCMVYAVLIFMQSSQAIPKSTEELRNKRKRLLMDLSVVDEFAGVDVKDELDFELLLKRLAQRSLMEAGPKIAKGQAVRNIVVNELATFTDKMGSFVKQELTTTAAAVLKAMDTEEGMLLLDPAGAAEANFPPLSQLIGGVISPLYLVVSLLFHLFHIVPISFVLILLCWAMYEDARERCPIPTIFLWTYAMTVLCVVLLCAHAWLSLATLRGGRIVRNKANEVSQRITQAKNDLGKGVDEVSLSEFRDVFVSQVVLLQQTLLVEQKVRGSRWNTVVGAGSLLWIVVVIWNLILVVGWTFVPGIISFHPAGEIGTPESYCGAWATVFTARLSAVISLLIIVTNVFSVAKWILEDYVAGSPTLGKKLLDMAKSYDDKRLGGCPVVETLVNALIMRGSADTVTAQLEIAEHELATLKKERDFLLEQREKVDSRVVACRAQAEALKGDGKISAPKVVAMIEKMERKPSIDCIDPRISTCLDMFEEEIIAAGEAAMAKTAAVTSAFPSDQEARERAAEVAKMVTEDINRLIEIIKERFKNLQQSEFINSLEKAGEEAAEHLRHLNAQEALQSAMTKGRDISHQLQESEAVQTALARGAEVAHQVQESESMKAALSKATEVARQVQDSDAGKTALSKATEVARQVQDSDAGKVALAKATEVARQVQDSATELASNASG